jgi:uncharacterized protein with ParB-like and HNH nuclease domain
MHVLYDHTFCTAQVIDGQQRLTTLLIILACVMDWANSR